MIWKHSYETVKEFIDTNTHFELMQDYIIDAKTPLKLKCKDCNESIMEISFHNLRRRVVNSKIINCDKCNRNQRQLSTIKEYLGKYGEGCLLIEKDYENLFEDYLEFICPSCNEHFFNTFDVLKMKKYKICKHCSDEIIAGKTRERARIHNKNKPPKEKKKRGNRGYTYEQVLEFVNSTNCKLVSTEYITAQTPMEFTCDVDGCNDTFITTYNIFKNFGRRKCTKHSNDSVGRKNAHTYEYVNQYIEKLGSKLLNDNYINNAQKIEVICTECNEPYFTNFAEIQRSNRVRCGKCGNKSIGESQLIPYDEVKGIILKEGCTLLSKEYKGSKEKLDILCSCGEHEFQTTLAGFKSGKIKCDYCMNQIQWNYELISEYVLNNSTATLISKEYINTHSDLEFRCECGNKFTVTWHDFYDETRKKRKCNECTNNSLLERESLEILNKYNIEYEYQKIFLDCKYPETNGQLKYDFYLPSYNLILETHGYQHDHPSKFCSTMTDEEAELELIERKKRDKFKEEYAHKNNYDFMVIWYYEMKQMEEIIKTKLKLTSVA